MRGVARYRSTERSLGGKGERFLGEKKNNHKNNEEQKVWEATSEELKAEEARQEESLLQREKAEEPKEERKEPTPLEKIQAELAEKSREAAEYFDKWLRLRAEFENFKKRMQKEKADLMKFGNESLLRSVLPIVDNLERAVDHGKSFRENTSLLEGVEITLKQFLNTLERFGVKPISAAGEVFDPEKHEAVSHEESDQEPNRVISEIQKGYLFYDRLLRPAKVIVSKAKGS